MVEWARESTISGLADTMEKKEALLSSATTEGHRARHV